jgi:predicted enzyme related to lactoylglutathione lyase
MTAPLNRVTIYTNRIPEMVAFYGRHFGYATLEIPGDRLIELRPPGPGLIIQLHQAGKGRKQGQSLVKLVFDVEDVPAFCQAAKKKGLTFGALHKGDGYVFANARDPSGNPIAVSGRAFRELAGG